MMDEDGRVDDADDDSIIQPTLPSDASVQLADGSEKAVSDLEPGDEIATDVEDNAETVTASFDENDDTSVEATNNDITYPMDKIDLRGESQEHLVTLMQQDEALLGGAELDKRVRTVGSWENLIIRNIFEPEAEQTRIEEALASLSAEERKLLTSKIRNDEGKIILQTGNIVQPVKPGEVKTVTGSQAQLAFECLDKGGGYRLPLYNSGITIDLIVPTGNDIQTLFYNFTTADRELGTGSGSHYFAYNDVVSKNQILTFLQPLIINSSYSDWRKKGKLWSVIKFPDLVVILATLAHMCYPKGFDGFLVRCTRPAKEDGTMCNHVEELKVNISSMIVTRQAALGRSAIDHMVQTMQPNASHGIGQIAEYQSALGLEGERISFDHEGVTITFTMRIPSLAEHLEAGKTFIADIINDIEGDNNEGRLEQFAVRYVRTFLPWIASVEKSNAQNQTVKTTDVKQITRELEKLDLNNANNELYTKLRGYINKIQLTYVGYPSTPCNVCGYAADTPSGMLTFDPFSAFFILAFQYLTKNL